jgi:hypothetical protein
VIHDVDSDSITGNNSESLLIAGNIRDAAEWISKSCSQVQLKKLANAHKPQNASLTAATLVNQQTTALKLKNKSDDLDVSVELWKYPLTGKQAVKVRVLYV